MFNKTVDLEKTDLRFDGFYRGIVMDVDDPLESGRVKIKAYPMFKDIETVDLPWAIYCDPSMGGSANIGSINIPIVGSHVFCFFENGDWRFPILFGGAPAISNDVPDVPTLSRQTETTVTTINTNAKKTITNAVAGTWDEPDSAYAAAYPENSVYRSKGGITVEIDDTTDNVRFHIFHPSGTREEIDNSGNRVEHTEGNKYTIVVGNDNIYITGAHNVTTDGDFNIYSKGDINIKSDGNFNVTANRIDLN